MRVQIQTNDSGYLGSDVRKWQDLIRVKPYTLKELCVIYDMSYKSMRSCLAPIAKKIGPRYGRRLTVRQVEIVMNHIGLPYTVKEAE